MDQKAKPKSDLSLPEILGALATDRWQILISIAIFLSLALLYIAASPNSYRADATVQLSKPLANRPTTDDALMSIAGQFNTQQITSAESAIIGSRAVLGHVVDSLSLDARNRPDRVPVFGTLFLLTTISAVLY